MRRLPWRSAWTYHCFLALLIGVGSCGEPIDPPGGRPEEAVRTLPVVASRRVDAVGEALRVAIELTRPSPGTPSRIAYVDLFTEVEDGRCTKWERHRDDGSRTTMSASQTGRLDFSVFEGLLPPRGKDVPESWQVEGVFAPLRNSTELREMPSAGGSADCRIESVQVRNGRARAVILFEFRAASESGPILLKGRLEHDLTEKLLVLAELDGTVAGDAVSIRATRARTNFVPPK